MNLILASQSPARQLILKRAGFEFEIKPADIDETELPGENAKDLVVRLSIEKAQAVADQFPNALIIGSDQVGTFKEHILGKSHGFEKGLEHLMMLSGQTTHFYNGLCLLNTKTDQHQTKLNVITVKFRKYTEEMATNYLTTCQPYECAGSLKVEGPGIRLIESIDSNDPNALEGLCVIDLVGMLINEGFPVESF